MVALIKVAYYEDGINGKATLMMVAMIKIVIIVEAMMTTTLVGVMVASDVANRNKQW